MMHLLDDVNWATIALACVIALALVAVPLYVDRGAVGIIVWPAIGMAQVLVGHAILDEIIGDSFWPAYAISGAAVLAGYYISRARYARPHEHSESPIPDKLAARRTLVAFAGAITAFVVYHFAAGGIPLLSTNVEVARFNFAGSGLFGIPGRMFLFGLPFLATYSSYVAAKDPDPRVIRLRNWLWAEYVVAMVLSGFKGSLVLVIIQWLVVRALLGSPISLRDLLRLRFAAVGIAAALFGAVVARQYESLELPGGTDGTVEYLAERITVVAAAPGAIAVRELNDRPSGTYIVDEVAYFAKKYFRVELVDHEVFPLDKVVSSTLLGTPLEEDEFVVAVTVGAYAAFVVDFGSWMALGLMLLVGSLYGYLASRAQLASSAFRFAGNVLALQALYTVVVNGGLVYSIVNTMVMLVILGTIHWFCSHASVERDASV